MVIKLFRHSLRDIEAFACEKTYSIIDLVHLSDVSYLYFMYPILGSSFKKQENMANFSYQNVSNMFQTCVQ